ncbi:MAG: hypothetical protein JKY22_01225 [Flavobacteriaceae bacterium]|nr:hypothetical protein [Flavobacteriaceae bacterium]
MKKTLTLLAILSFLYMNAQFKEGTIYLKDSTEIKGLIKFKTFGGVKYKEDEGSDIREYEDSQLSGYDINENGIIKKYRSKKVGANFPRIMKIEKLGKINLYSIFGSNAGSAMGLGLPVSEGYVFFLEKNNITIRTGAKFKNGKLHLIEDCPTLIDKIKKKEFKKRDVIEIIDYYNKKCD